MPVPDQTFRVDGLRELERNLEALANEYSFQQARKTLTTPLNRAVAPILAQVQQDTPVDTGALRESVARRTGAANRFYRREEPGAVAQARVGWFWAAGNSQWFQALAVEFGQPREGIAGTAVLRNALAQNANDAVRIFRDELGPQIERTARRLSRRR